jgi:acyl-CoA thioester hydrolase
MVREAGISQLDMKAQGFVFAVRRVEADYLKPAHFEDELIVETRASGLKGASFDMPQRVLRGEEVLLEALVKVVVLNARAARPVFRRIFAQNWRRSRQMTVCDREVFANPIGSW